MLSNIRKKINNAIQEGIIISENLQQQYRQRVGASGSIPTLGEISRSRSNSRSSLTNSGSELGLPADVNVAAGCNLLAKYEDDWKCVHQANEENAAKALHIAGQIDSLEKRATAQHITMNDLVVCLSGIPALLAKLNASIETLQEVKTLSQTVESEFERLQDLCEECELQEFMIGKQFELSQYKQKKMADLEAYRQKVAAEHQQKIRKHEEHLRQIQRERQAVFEDAFRNDLEEFKQTGTIPKIQNGTGTKVTLEEVVLEDTETKDALEEFLNG